MTNEQHNKMDAQVKANSDLLPEGHLSPQLEQPACRIASRPLSTPQGEEKPSRPSSPTGYEIHLADGRMTTRGLTESEYEECFGPAAQELLRALERRI